MSSEILGFTEKAIVDYGVEGFNPSYTYLIVFHSTRSSLKSGVSSGDAVLRVKGCDLVGLIRQGMSLSDVILDYMKKYGRWDFFACGLEDTFQSFDQTYMLATQIYAVKEGPIYEGAVVFKQGEMTQSIPSADLPADYLIRNNV